jgi:hypothetical protein
MIRIYVTLSKKHVTLAYKHDIMIRIYVTLSKKHVTLAYKHDIMIKIHVILSKIVVNLQDNDAITVCLLPFSVSKFSFVVSFFVIFS